MVKPLDMYRFGYVMALDSETGLLLKTETRDLDDHLLEKYQFANLSYDPRVPETEEADVVHQALHPHPAHSAGSSALTSSGGRSQAGTVATPPYPGACSAPAS